MGEDATWYRSRPRPRPHCVKGGPSSPCERGTAAPLFLAHVYCSHSSPSQLLLSSCSTLVLTGLPYASTLFKSPMPVLVLHLPLTYFQNAFGFSLQCGATFCCYSFCTLGVSFLTGRPFIKGFALCYQTVVCPICL